MTDCQGPDQALLNAAACSVPMTARQHNGGKSRIREYHKGACVVGIPNITLATCLLPTTGLCMVAAYSLTCPTGVAIGIGIAHSYDETSLKAVAIEVSTCTYAPVHWLHQAELACFCW
jgi:hypothetical protein